MKKVLCGLVASLAGALAAAGAAEAQTLNVNGSATINGALSVAPLL